MHDPETVSVLIVEDDEVVVEALERALRRHDVPNPVVFAGDGREALRILRGEHPERSIRRPYVILLDIVMPVMNGFEFLRALRTDEQLASDVVFVMTTSDADRDLSEAYDAHVAGYMVKAEVGHNFGDVIDMLEHYCAAVHLPMP